MKLYLSSEDSKHVYPDNTPSNFRVQLPQHLHLGKGNWQCGILNCILPTKPSAPMYLTCDIIEPSILGDRYQPVLTILTSKAKEFLTPDYTNVKVTHISTIQLKLINRLGVPNPIRKGETIVVLKLQHDIS